MVTDRITIETEYYTEGTITSVRIPKVLLPAFQQLIARGINTWDQAPQEIKDFVDELSGNTKLLGTPLLTTVYKPAAPNEFRLVRNCGSGAITCSYPQCHCPR